MRSQHNRSKYMLWYIANGVEIVHLHVKIHLFFMYRIFPHWGIQNKHEF